MELEGKIINFLGDSITQGCGVSSPQAIFHSLLKERYNLKEARNYGEGGTRIARQGEITSLVRDRDFILRATNMENADMVVVFGGTNDFGTGQAALGALEDKTMYTFYGGVQALIDVLKKQFKHIVFITPLHRLNEDGKGAWKPEGVEQRPLCEYAQAVKEVCTRNSVPVLDLFFDDDLLGNDPEWCREYMPDGVHPNDKCHQIIAKKLGAFLENL